MLFFLGFGFLALLAISRNARVRLLLPTDVAETGPLAAQPEAEILWLPDTSTGGFPVLPVTKAA